jgi:hypothetical protein
MRVWQLSSLCRVDPGLIRRVWGQDQRYSPLMRWFYEDLPRLVDTQDRTVLDAELPEDFVIGVLERLELPYYFDDMGNGVRYLRSFRHTEGDRELTALEAYREFGNVLEDVQEKGAERV